MTYISLNSFPTKKESIFDEEKYISIKIEVNDETMVVKIKPPCYQFNRFRVNQFNKEKGKKSFFPGNLHYSAVCRAFACKEFATMKLKKPLFPNRTNQ